MCVLSVFRRKLSYDIANNTLANYYCSSVIIYFELPIVVENRNSIEYIACHILMVESACRVQVSTCLVVNELRGL